MLLHKTVCSVLVSTLALRMPKFCLITAQAGCVRIILCVLLGIQVGVHLAKFEKFKKYYVAFKQVCIWQISKSKKLIWPLAGSNRRPWRY